MCDLRNHPLIEIFRSGHDDGYDAQAVIRWCPDCGAIVVDGECDGRTYAGHFSKMKFPKVAQLLVKKQA